MTKKYTPRTETHNGICRFCCCDPENDNLSEAIEKLFNCTNCRADIGLKGNWTGNGWPALLALIKKHGKEAVAAELGKHMPEGATHG